MKRKKNNMNAEILLKERYPTIEFDDKWDYLAQRFSADDMIYFAKLYAQKQKGNAALPPVNVTAWVFDGKDPNGRNISIFIEAPDRESAIAYFESNYEGYRYWQVRQLHLG